MTPSDPPCTCGGSICGLTKNGEIRKKRYRCPGCARKVPWCYGAADDLPHLCDGCWGLLTRRGPTEMPNAQRHILPDPCPEALRLAVLTIFVPENFQGVTEVVWQPLGKSCDVRRQRVTCSSTALLQGVFRDVRGTRPGALFDARVVALVLHAFYRTQARGLA